MEPHIENLIKQITTELSRDPFDDTRMKKMEENQRSLDFLIRDFSLLKDGIGKLEIYFNIPLEPFQA